MGKDDKQRRKGTVRLLEHQHIFSILSLHRVVEPQISCNLPDLEFSFST